MQILLADHASYYNWTENALNIALTCAAWAVADSFARRGRPALRLAPGNVAIAT